VCGQEKKCEPWASRCTDGRGGSSGAKGLVTAALGARNRAAPGTAGSHLGCGPNAMLWAIGRMARDRRQSRSFNSRSTEQMACGPMAAARLRDHGALAPVPYVCSNGPVCDASDVLDVGHGVSDRRTRRCVPSVQRYMESAAPYSEPVRCRWRRGRRHRVTQPIITGVRATFVTGANSEKSPTCSTTGGLVTRVSRPRHASATPTPRLRDRIGEASNRSASRTSASEGLTQEKRRS